MSNIWQKLKIITNMKKFKLSFTARLIGAIGKLQKFTETVEAENLEAAKFKLYKKYEHITFNS
jgi:predicted negative regulator of RcsB-dependent stress response